LEFRKNYGCSAEEFQEKAQKNLVESKAFLEENKKKEGIQTLSSGLQYKYCQRVSGKIPKATDTVTVQYRGPSSMALNSIARTREGSRQPFR